MRLLVILFSGRASIAVLAHLWVHTFILRFPCETVWLRNFVFQSGILLYSIVKTQLTVPSSNLRFYMVSLAKWKIRSTNLLYAHPVPTAKPSIIGVTDYIISVCLDSKSQPKRCNTDQTANWILDCSPGLSSKPNTVSISHAHSWLWLCRTVDR